MARFFVGQRVRVNCPESDFHGAETVVTGLEVMGNECGHIYIGTQVELLSKRGRLTKGKPCVFEDHELIPILPAHQPVAIAALLEEFPSLSGVLGVTA